MSKKISIKKVMAVYVLLFLVTVIYTNLFFSLGVWSTVTAFLYGLLSNGFVLVVTIWLTNIFLKHLTNQAVFVIGALACFVLLWILNVFVIMPVVYNYFGKPEIAYFAFWAPIIWIISVIYS